jgi:hypothetical protein
LAVLSRAALAGLALAAGCSSYQEQAEFWPRELSLSDASAPPAPAAGEDASAPVLDASVGGGSQDDAIQPAGDTGSAPPPPPPPPPTPDAATAGAEDATVPTIDADVPPMYFDAPAGAPCALSVTVTTVTDNGQFSPRNIGAIWIAKPDGTFLKTLAVWAKTRINDLNTWNNVTGAANLRRSTVDAITGATLSMHQAHNVKWNCKDTSEAAVPDGPYRVYFEWTDNSGQGPVRSVDFVKGARAFTLSPPDSLYFKGIQIQFVP